MFSSTSHISSIKEFISSSSVSVCSKSRFKQFFHLSFKIIHSIIIAIIYTILESRNSRTVFLIVRSSRTIRLKIVICIIFLTFFSTIFRTTFKLIKSRNPHTSLSKLSIVRYRIYFQMSPTLNRFVSMSIRIIDMISSIPSIKFIIRFSTHFFVLLIIIFSLSSRSITTNSSKSISLFSINHTVITSSVLFITFWNSITIYSTIWNYSIITVFIFFYTFIESLPKSKITRTFLTSKFPLFIILFVIYYKIYIFCNIFTNCFTICTICSLINTFYFIIQFSKSL